MMIIRDLFTERLQKLEHSEQMMRRKKVSLLVKNAINNIKKSLETKETNDKVCKKLMFEQ